MSWGRTQAIGICAAILAACGGCGKGSESSAATPGGSFVTARNADGVLALTTADGAPADGVKLSQYDQLIYSPCIAVGTDNVIHVAFVEQMPTSPYTQFVYHRQSSDGGKTWSDPKNLSEDLADVCAGSCKLAIDGQNRTYVVWRSGAFPYAQPVQNEAQDSVSNLVYRYLDGGKWSKVAPVHKPTSKMQDDGALSFMLAIDSAGKVQVLFNTSPNRFHPEALCPNGLPGSIGWGLIFQSTLDGSTPPTPREWYLSPITVNGPYDRHGDGFNALSGYFDNAGQAHVLAQLVQVSNLAAVNMVMIEGGKQSPPISLPSDAFGGFSAHPPRLLLDAKGGQHMIAKYDAGEHPAIRDYLLGSGDDPAVIMSAKPPGIISDFRAWQGPSGKMAAVIETQVQQTSGEGDSWLCTNDGDGKWSEPICLTNNAGRRTWASKNTGALGSVSSGDSYGPGPGAVAWDKDGHPMVLLINNKTGSFGLAAGGVVYTAGSSTTPMLFFYHL